MVKGNVFACIHVTSLKIAPEKMFIVGTEANEHFIHLIPGERKYLAPEAPEAGYMDRLNEIVEKEKIEFIHAQPDIEVAIISENREKLEANVFLPSREKIVKCQDKLESTKNMAKKGCPNCEVLGGAWRVRYRRAFEEFGTYMDKG